MATFYSSKLQFFDKGEKRYVLFEKFKQYNLREILPRSCLKVFCELFFKKAKSFVFLTIR